MRAGDTGVIAEAEGLQRSAQNGHVLGRARGVGGGGIK